MMKTNLQRRASYWDRIIEEGKKSKYTPFYTAVCDSVADLVKISNKLKGSDRIMKPDEFAELKIQYEETKRKCDEYLKGSKEFSDFENSRKPIITEISNVLAKDLKELADYNPMSLRTLSQVIKKARTHTVILNRDDFKTIGGALSSRLPLKLANKKKGFFTRNKTFNLDSEWKEKIERFEAEFESAFGRKIPQNVKEKLESLKTDEQLRAKFRKKIPPKMPQNLRGTAQIEKAVLIPLAIELGLGDDAEAVSQLLSVNNGAPKNALFDFTHSVVPLSFEETVMGLAGIKKNSTITNRNCAMSDVARLMGCGHLLAAAEPMEIIVEGEKVEGVFMEVAEGSDIGHLKEDDPLYYVTQRSVENAEFLQQVTDLQVLDFICGNIDRHKGNMIYQIHSAEGNPPVFTGIKGIDNDCAFGTPKIVEGKQILRMVNPESMQYITPAMAVKVNELKKDMFVLSLRNNGITEEEINAAWDRVEKVREAIEKKKIQIIEKKDWETKKLRNREVEDGNYFDTIKDIQESCKEKEWAVKRDQAKKMGLVGDVKPIEYVKDRYDFADTLIAKKDRIADLRKKMEKSKAIFFNSSEYNSMKKNFENVEALTLRMEEKKIQGQKIEEEDIEKLTNAYLVLGKKTDRYIELKKLLPIQERGKDRRAFAVDLLNLAYDTLDGIGVEFDKEDKEATTAVEETEKER